MSILNLLCVSWGAVVAITCLQPSEPAATETKSEPPKDVASLLAAKSFPETKMYFETLIDGRPVGYHVSTLTPAKGKEGAKAEADVAYEYRAESILTRDNGMRIDGVVIARLRRNFEPVSITLDRQLAHPEAPTRHIEDRAQVSESEIALTHEDNMASSRTPPRSVPKPKEPFVFGMEFVVEAMDVNKNATLPIAELNPQDGTVSVYKIVRGRGDGDKQEMVLQKADGGIGYRFTVGPEGRIEAWADSASPIMMKRCSEVRFKEVRKAIDGK